jgi:hypothetical protein
MGTMTPRFWAECEWINKHYPELVQKYANMWVAVVNQKVIAANANLKEVEESVLKQTDRKDIPFLYIEDGSHVY